MDLSVLLPSLALPLAPEFNVFDVLRYGGHERQISDVFAWLLNADESHVLGDRFVRHFVDEVNEQLKALGEEPISYEEFIVSQEVNAAGKGQPADVADLVLLGKETALVVENYFISDGHEHSYRNYVELGLDLGAERSIAVMLCELRDESLMASGWENAPIVTYGRVLRRLGSDNDSDRGYRERHPEQAWFIKQIVDRYVGGRSVDSATVERFIKATCDSGAAEFFGMRNRRDQFVE